MQTHLLRGMDFRLPCNASTRNCKAMECRLTESFFSEQYRRWHFREFTGKTDAKETHEQWLHCYSDYETCLGNHYLTPNLKGKLFTYISAQKTLSNTQRNKLGSGQWLFNDAQYWNLNAPELQPLKDFLCNNIS